MTKVQASPTVKVDEARQWCITARKLLNLGILDRKKLDLKDRATAISKNLASLRGKLGDKAFTALESEFLAIAKRIDTEAKAGNRSQVEVEAERLNVLNKQLQVELAKLGKNPQKAQKKAEGELEAAQNQLNAKLLVQRAEYNRLLLDSETKLNNLRPIKYAVTTIVEARITAAKNKVTTIGKEDWAAGIDLLGTVSGLVDEAKKTAENWQADDLRHAAAQKHYESKQLKIAETLEELEGVPGVETYITQLKLAKNAGAEAIKKPEQNPIETLLYQDGYDAIVGIIPKTGKFLKEALEAAAKAQKLIAKDPEILAAEEQTRAALAKLRTPDEELIGEGEEQTHSAAIARGILLCGEPGKKEFGIKLLNKIKADLENLHRERLGQRTDCSTKVQQAAEHIKALLYAPTEEERLALQEPLGEFQIARTLFSALEFQAASDMLVPLLKTLKSKVDSSDHTPDKLQSEWETLAAPPKGLLPLARKNVQQISTLLEQNKLPGAANLDATFLAKSYTAQLDKIESMAVTDKNYGKAVTSLEGISVDIANQLARQRELAKFVTERNTLVGQVQLEITKAETALKTLETELGKKGPTGNTYAIALAELEGAKKIWNERLSLAMSAAELKADEAKTVFKDQATKLQKLATTPVELDKAIVAGRKDTARKAFDTLAGEVQVALNQLRDLSATTFAVHDKTWDTINKSSAKGSLSGPGSPTEKMTALKNTVLQAITSSKETLAGEQRTAQAKYQEVARQIEALKKSAKKSLKSKHYAFFSPFFEALDQDLKDLTGMLESSSVKTVQTSIVELTALAKRVVRLQNEVNTKPEGDRREAAQTLLGKNDEGLSDDESDMGLGFLFSEAAKVTPNFRLVMEAISAISSDLKDKNLGQCMPVQKAMLDEDFKNLQKTVNQQEPVEAFADLRAFSQRLTDAIARAALAAERRQQFWKVELPAVETKFKTLSGFTPDSLRGKLEKFRKEPKAYFSELENRIKGVKGLISEPQKEQKALDDLAKILTDIQAVMDADENMLPEQLVAKEKEAQAREFQQEKEATQWKALVRDFKRMDLERAETAVNEAEGGDKSQIKDLKRMLKQAEDIFGDTGNFIGAVELLNNAKQYAARVRNHPQGLKAASRDELPKVLAHWKTAVAQFNSSVDAVIKNIHDADDDAGVSVLMGEEEDEGVQAAKRLAEAIAKSVDLLSGLKKLFNANVMDGPIAVLTSKRAAVKEKRAARELALKYVRSYGDLLRNDPVLLKLLQKDRPFGSVDFYGLNAALRDLDLNVQRSV